MTSVGFVGLGNMGWPMARNLATTGHELVVHDADRDRSRQFVSEHGGTAATDPEGFRATDAVVTMLPTGAIVREVLLEWDGGLARALRRGAIVVDMSSSDPPGTRELGRALEPLGVVLVDAPVSGGVPRAESGTLSIMVGTDDEDAARKVEPLLEVMGERLFRTGSLGTGHAMKALNNFVASASYTATAEALIVGQRFGLDPAVVVEVLNTSTGRSFNSEYTMAEHVLPRRFATGFALGLLAKDVRIAAELANAVGVEAPLSRLLDEVWAEALREEGAAADFSAAIRTLERANATDLPARPAP